MHTSTSYQPMRTPVILPRQQRPEPGEPVKPRPQGSVHPARPGRSTERRRAIAESAGAR